MNSSKTIQRSLSNYMDSYVNHITHIKNIPNPEQIQYMSFTHSIAWTFNKSPKCKNKKIIFIIK